jgi:hypothetical protein
VTYFIDESSNSKGGATLKIAGRILSVYRTGGGCVYMFNTQPVPGSGGAIDFGLIKNNPTCNMIRRGELFQDLWLQSGDAAPNFGSPRIGAISFVVSFNPGNSVTIAAGLVYATITQASGCTYTLTKYAADAPAAGANGIYDIQAVPGCESFPTPDVDWITINLNPHLYGSGTIGYTVAANTGAARTGTITAAGQTFTINQAAGTCSFQISPQAQEFTSAGGTGTITVSGQVWCAYSSLNESSFVTLNSGATGTEKGTVTFTVAPNSGAARSFTMFVAGQNFTVNQAAAVKSRKRVRFF